MEGIGLVFSAVNMTSSVAKLIGVIESLDSKIDRLVKSDLTAGFRNLEQACASENEQTTLLREARNCFNKAIALETGLRQGLSYLGLAACHYHLGDSENCQKALEEILLLPPAVGAGDTSLAFLSGMTNNGHPIVTLFSQLSKQNRTEYREVALLRSVAMSADARSLLKIQKDLADYIGKPVKWLSAIDQSTRYEFNHGKYAYRYSDYTV
jgi:tetratricopeptide (TPR) repeat protein